MPLRPWPISESLWQDQSEDAFQWGKDGGGEDRHRSRAGYNTIPEKAKFHPNGRDNGYVLTMGRKKNYVASDTEDAAEIRALTGIDIALLSMNLPCTMTLQKAADAIRQF